MNRLIVAALLIGMDCTFGLVQVKTHLISDIVNEDLRLATESGQEWRDTFANVKVAINSFGQAASALK